MCEADCETTGCETAGCETKTGAEAKAGAGTPPFRPRCGSATVFLHFPRPTVSAAARLPRQRPEPTGRLLILPPRDRSAGAWRTIRNHSSAYSAPRAHRRLSCQRCTGRRVRHSARGLYALAVLRILFQKPCSACLLLPQDVISLESFRCLSPR